MGMASSHNYVPRLRIPLDRGIAYGDNLVAELGVLLDVGLACGLKHFAKLGMHLNRSKASHHERSAHQGVRYIAQ